MTTLEHRLPMGDKYFRTFCAICDEGVGGGMLNDVKGVHRSGVGAVDPSEQMLPPSGNC